MAGKVENMTWLELVDSYKLKDNGLKKALKEYAESRIREEYDEALKALATLAKLGTDLKNSKEAKAAGPDVIKRIAKLIEGIATSRKEWEKKKCEQEKAGTRFDVQIVLQAWNGKSMYGSWAKVELSPTGGTSLKRELGIANTILNIKDVYLKPTSGSLDLSVFRVDELFCQGNAQYDVKPGKTELRFKFVQDSTIVKQKAKTTEELLKKLGMKGGASLEIKILKVEGEITKESEYKAGFEKEVEWEVEVGTEKFKEQKQV